MGHRLQKTLLICILLVAFVQVEDQRADRLRAGQDGDAVVTVRLHALVLDLVTWIKACRELDLSCGRRRAAQTPAKVDAGTGFLKCRAKAPGDLELHHLRILAHQKDRALRQDRKPGDGQDFVESALELLGQ